MHPSKTYHSLCTYRIFFRPLFCTFIQFQFLVFQCMQIVRQKILITSMYGIHVLQFILLLYFIAFVLSRPCSITQDAGNVTNDCSYHNLVGVPTGILRNTTHLLLNNNRIRSLPVGAFHAMAGLVHLDLSNNLISGFNQDTFTGQHNLTYLNLEFNKMCMDFAAYPIGLFRNRLKLNILKLIDMLHLVF